MDLTTDILFELPRVLRIYADGRVERFPESDSVQAGLDLLTQTTSKDVVIDPDAPIRARVYLPETTSSGPNPKMFPILVYYHGGGFISGTISERPTHDFLNKVAAHARVLIVSVEYRLAPENPLPVPYDDSWTAFQWAVSGSDEWVSEYGDTTHVFIAGESAGANIAHGIAMRVGDIGLGSRATKEVDGLVLVHPLFWGSERMGAETDPNPDNVLKPEQLDAGWQLVCGPQEEVDLDDPRLNPFAEKAPPLSKLGCKRVLVCVAGKDLLCERGRAYWEKLGKSGWKGTAEIMESEGEDHGFYFDSPESDKAVELMDRVVGFFGSQQ